MVTIPMTSQPLRPGQPNGQAAAAASPCKSPPAEGAAAAAAAADASSAKPPVAHTNGVHHEGFSPVLRDHRAKDPGPPQAVVRPQILTHVLGDFVIQESSEPFPVGRFHQQQQPPPPPPADHAPCVHHQQQQQQQPQRSKAATSLDGEPPSKWLLFVSN